ncbi:MAG: 50S ribosomal protein L25 [Actinobacteria bacterium]|nr:50S ribosomal protein L25 [Actinomycetota bacterium]
METVRIQVEERQDFGTSPMRRLRKAGKLPAVVYGKGKDTVALTIDAARFREAVSGAHVILELEFPDKRARRFAQVKATQLHHVKHVPLHVDLLEVDLTHEIESPVNIELVGDAAGLANGGILDFHLRSVTVLGMHTKMPDMLPVDVSALEVGDHLRVGDIPVPGGLTILDDPETLVVVIMSPAVAEVEVEEVEEAAGEEAGASEGAASEE